MKFELRRGEHCDAERRERASISEQLEQKLRTRWQTQRRKCEVGGGCRIRETFEMQDVGRTASKQGWLLAPLTTLVEGA